MEINADKAIGRPSKTVQSVETRGGGERVPSRVIATVTDIKPDEVTLRLRSGHFITGRTKAPIEAGIGSVREFSANFENGTLTLQMRPVAENLMQRNAIIEMLMQNGMKASQENVKLAQSLIENKMPVTAENLQKLTQAARVLGLEVSSPEANTDKAMFFLKNQMPPTAKNAELLNNYIGGSAKMNSQINNLLTEIRSLPENLQRVVLDALGGGKEQGGTRANGVAVNNSAVNNLSANNAVGTSVQTQAAAGANTAAAAQSTAATVGKPSATQEAGQAANAPAETQNAAEMQGKVGQREAAALRPEERAAIIRESIGRGGGLEGERAARPEVRPEQADSLSPLRARLKFDFEGSKPADVDEFLNDLKSNLEAAGAKLAEAGPQGERVLKAIDDIKSGMEFVNQMKNNIFVQLPVTMNNQLLNSEILVFKDKRSKKQSGSSASAMIALDTITMGRFEVYVQKKNRSVSCQFRLRDDDIEKLVKGNLTKLKTLLDEYRYELDLCSYHKTEDSFTIMEQEPQAEIKTEGGRTAFDMRL